MNINQKYNVSLNGYVWTACFLILFAAKVFGFATYSWWIVFSPYLILSGLYGIVLFLFVIVSIIQLASKR